MRTIKKVLIILTIITLQILANEPGKAPKGPTLNIEPSKYINMLNTNLTVSNGSTIFEGKFFVMGEGIFGHFNAVVYGDSDKVFLQVKSVNRAWRRDRGGKIKSVSFNIGNIPSNSKVFISFREMRVE